MKMTICILDPANHMLGLKLCLTEADYYAHVPDGDAFLPDVIFESAYDFKAKLDCLLSDADHSEQRLDPFLYLAIAQFVITKIKLDH